jgi:hypothetical protein
MRNVLTLVHDKLAIWFGFSLASTENFYFDFWVDYWKVLGAADSRNLFKTLSDKMLQFVSLHSIKFKITKSGACHQQNRGGSMWRRPAFCRSRNRTCEARTVATLPLGLKTLQPCPRQDRIHNSTSSQSVIGLISSTARPDLIHVFYW